MTRRCLIRKTRSCTCDDFCPKITRICPKLSQAGTALKREVLKTQGLGDCPSVPLSHRFFRGKGREAPTFERTSTFPQVEIFKEPGRRKTTTGLYCIIGCQVYRECNTARSAFRFAVGDISRKGRKSNARSQT